MALICEIFFTHMLKIRWLISEIAPVVLSLHRDSRILKLPGYLSTLCIFVGIVWLLLLPLNDYSRQTYISENALLPGQVHTYFGGSEQNIFRAYKREVEALSEADPDR
jgi:glycosylphosphatidylinositol transamidase